VKHSDVGLLLVVVEVVHHWSSGIVGVSLEFSFVENYSRSASLVVRIPTMS